MKKRYLCNNRIIEERSQNSIKLKGIIIFSFACVLLGLLPLASGGWAGEQYSVGNSISLIRESNAIGSTFQATTYLTPNTGGEARSSLYQLIVGFFKRIMSVSAYYSVTLNQTGIVEAGNVYTLNIEVINLSGNVEISSAPKVTLYDSLGNLIVSNADAEFISGKKYQYNFTTSPTHTAGTWKTNVSIGINNIAKKYNQNWTLSNGRTAISINSINADSSPVISANVTITNEDSIGYEYPYQYCIVSVSTQQCGNPENVAYGSGYKLLGAGESWSPILSLNIAQSGNYWFKVVANYGTQNSGATKSFSAIYTPSGGGGSSSGGGGGGSGGAPEINSYFDADFTIKEKVTFNAVQGSIKTFTFDKINSHSVKIESVSENKVTFIIKSEPVIVIMNIREIKEVDINGDGLNDIRLYLKGVKDGFVEFDVEKIDIGVAGITGQTIKRPENLMDVIIKVLEDYRIVTPDKNHKVLVEITLFNLGTEEIKDVVFTYCIRDENNNNNNKLIGECVRETIAVQTKVQLVKRIFLPSGMEDGVYSVSVKASYLNETAEAKDSFEVREKGLTRSLKDEIFNMTLNKYSLIIGIMSLISVMLFALILIILFKRKNKKRKIESIEFKLQHLKELKMRKEIKDSSYHRERERLLQNIQDIFKNKALSILLLGIGLFALIRIFAIEGDITGYSIVEHASSNLNLLGYLILLLASFGLLMFINRNKIKEKITDARESMMKRHPRNSVRGLIGKKVYSEGGDYLGKINEIILGGNTIESLIIGLNKIYKFKAKSIIVSYKYVRAVGGILIIDESVLNKVRNQEF